MSKFYFLFRFSFLDHYDSSCSSLKTTTDNYSSRFNFRNEKYTGGNPGDVLSYVAVSLGLG